MVKRAFDDNVPKVRPRLRLGGALDGTEAASDPPTEPPPARPAEQPLPGLGAEPPRRRSVFHDMLSVNTPPTVLCASSDDRPSPARSESSSVSIEVPDAISTTSFW